MFSKIISLIIRIKHSKKKMWASSERFPVSLIVWLEDYKLKKSKPINNLFFISAYFFLLSDYETKEKYLKRFLNLLYILIGFIYVIMWKPLSLLTFLIVSNIIITYSSGSPLRCLAIFFLSYCLFLREIIFHNSFTTVSKSKIY